MVMRIALLLMLFALPAWAEDRLTVSVPDIAPVAGQMIPVLIRGEYEGSISLEEMEFPDSEFYDWVQYTPDQWSIDRTGGNPRRIFERRVAVFSRLPGTLTIGPVTHRLTKSVPWGREVAEVTAPVARIGVMPYPTGGRTLASPAVTLKDELSTDPTTLTKGETFTRRITLMVDGSMAQFLPDRPKFDEDWLVSIAMPETRETRLTERGPIGVVIWEWQLRLAGDEVGTIPPIHFPFFNTIPRKMWSAITLPVDIGAKSAAAGAGSVGSGTKLLAGGLLGLGLVLGLIAMLIGSRVTSRDALRQTFQRLRTNPHRRAVGEAGTIDALWQAARRYADHETAAGRGVDAAALAAIDRAMFGSGSDVVDVRGLASDLITASRRADQAAARGGRGSAAKQQGDG